jgi:hypothetical protein
MKTTIGCGYNERITKLLEFGIAESRFNLCTGLCAKQTIGN